MTHSISSVGHEEEINFCKREEKRKGKLPNGAPTEAKRCDIKMGETMLLCCIRMFISILIMLVQV